MANRPLSPTQPNHGDPAESNEEQLSRPKSSDRPVRSKRPTTSPFFGAPSSTSPKKRSPKKPAPKVSQDEEVTATLKPKKARPPRGTVSCLPIPSLSATQFGLIQEELAHNPFHLLMGVTFLIRTTGKAAIPIIRDFTARFPTPQSMAEADPGEIISMIRHLGLSAVRCRNLQKYARTWIQQPPTKHIRYGMKNYPNQGDGARVHGGERFGPEGEAAHDMHEDANLHGLGSAWEIGHIAEGPYAVDSWRIFCRDELLGRADDWLGKGREPEFQPEWMRVLPKDKELRAYLRWLWCREGWEWDPETGARSVLRDELREALDAGRVGYDNQGRMVILETNPNDESEDEVEDVGEGKGKELLGGSDFVPEVSAEMIEEGEEVGEGRASVSLGTMIPLQQK